LQLLHPAANDININKAIYSMYLEDLLPKLTLPDDDGNYGSASVCDVHCLQVSQASDSSSCFQFLIELCLQNFNDPPF